MKKLISALLCVTLLVCSCCISTLGAPAPKVDETLFNKVATVLTELEIADKDDSLVPEGFITYNEFLGYLSNLTNSSGRIDYSAYGVGSHLANEVITYDAALKITVNLLGWSFLAEKKSYQAVANSLDLTDGLLNTNDAFSRYDALVLIYNALDADYLVQTKYGDAIEYSSNEDTILSLYKDIYKFSGILKATKWSTVYSAGGLDDNKVTIEDDDGSVTQYIYKGVASMDLLGVYITGYYKANGGNPEIVSMHNDSECISLYSENTPYFNKTERSIEYYDSGNMKKVKLPVDVTVVLNGRNCADPSVINDTSFADLDSVKLYKVDGKYKSIHISMSTSHVVETVSSGGSTLGFLNGGAVEFDDSEYDETVFFYDENGDKIRFFDIKAGNIITIYRSINNGTDSPVMKIYAYDNSFAAKVASSGQKDGEKYLNISKISVSEDGIVSYSDEIKLTYAYGFESDIQLASTYKLYVDKFDRIVASEYASSGDGRLTGLYIKIESESEGLSNGYRVMMMTDLDSDTSGAEILEISSKARLEYEDSDKNRKTVKLDTADVSELNSNLMHTVVYYYTNVDGVVTRIVGSSSTQQNGYLYNFNPENEYLGTGGISSQIIVASKMRDDTNGKFGGIPVTFDENKPSTYFGGKTIQYGEVSKEMILLPDISSPDEVSVKYLDSYYKKVPVAQYGITIAQSFFKYNAFSHDGGFLPDYGTIVWDTDNYYAENTYRLFNSMTGFLVDTVSWVESKDGGKIMKLSGTLNTTATTLYSATDKIIDAGNSTEDNVKYMAEISAGDILMVQRNGNGDVTVALKICDYDPQTKNLSIPSTVIADTLYRAYYDEASNTLIDEMGMVNGDFMLNKVLNSKKSAYIAYPYKLTKHAFNKASLGASFVVDPTKITNEDFPDKNPEQHELKLAISTVMYFDTEAKEGEKRVGGSAMLNMVSYFDDPANMSKVFIYTVSNEPRFAVIYK